MLLAKPNGTDEEFWQVLEKMKLADFLRSEQGLDTMLAEKGSNFSGGQCQRLVMARALLHDSPVYIFDEATSNIDAESENDIMEQIYQMKGKKTVLLISHRLANVTAADKIYVLEQGKVTEQGNHEDPYYAKWKLCKIMEHPAEAGGLQKGEGIMKKRNHWKLMLQLSGLVKPLSGYMVLAVLMGLAGHLCATFITVFAGFAMLAGLGEPVPVSISVLFLAMGGFALMRGILRYGEQACNHFIAFKLLALIRDKVFCALRRLCPAKLEGKEKGSLISVITSDIELLEVFYAHTISPALDCPAVLYRHSLFLGSYHPVLGILAFAFLSDCRGFYSYGSIQTQWLGRNAFSDYERRSQQFCTGQFERITGNSSISCRRQKKEGNE